MRLIKASDALYNLYVISIKTFIFLYNII